MRRFQCALLAALAVFGFASIASAADMPVKAAPMVAPVAAYNWTGFYVGANGGYGWADRTTDLAPGDPFMASQTCGGLGGGTCPTPASFDVNGGLGGLQIGYNWQFAPQWVAGFETDFDWSNLKGTGNSNFVIGGLGIAFPSAFSATQDIKWFGTVRARLGYLPTNSLLAYLTGGFAYGQVHENLGISTGGNLVTVSSAYFCSFAVPPLVIVPNCFSGNSSRTATGWTVGGGLEFAAWKNVTIKLEYLYVDLGGGDTVRVIATNTIAPGNPLSSFTASFNRTDFNIVRAGVNYRF